MIFLTAHAAESSADPGAKLARYMTGTFSNAEQSRYDQNFREFILHTAPIWPERTDGLWLYSEQALAGAVNHPFRQTLYQIVTQPDGRVEVRLFQAPDPVRITGAWKKPDLFIGVTPDALLPREGCTLFLELQPDGVFRGATRGEGCASSTNGSRYSTTEAAFAEREQYTWERGFNARGTQVWGSIHGGYKFVRIE
ncbi:MAG: chromophore lyase CpcT/CpeT [Opitutaceae bacterium]|nr:chromophore lyase CpcT/CpeT [Opitutaceae bacterium]